MFVFFKRNHSLLIPICLGIVFFGCKEETQLPTVITGQVSNITLGSANVSGSVEADGNSKLIERGVVYGIIEMPTIDDHKELSQGGVGGFSVTVSNLKAATTYFVRAFARNSIGISYGKEVSFKTNAGLPSILTQGIVSITGQSAVGGGNILDDGGAEVIARGICWSTTQSPTIAGNKTIDGMGIGQFESSITDLQPATKYYVRAYATNLIGTAYGSEADFTTPLFIIGNGITDTDGNTYKTIVINGIEWMAENLKVAKYRNGDFIPEVTDGLTWAGLTTGAYSYYDNEASNNNFLGKLYNWYTVVDSRSLCPQGWHVPTQLEWSALIDYLGGYDVAGGKMKTADYWMSPNIGATNESGFSGLPSGFRYELGKFGSTGNAMWWSTTELSVLPDRAYATFVASGSASASSTFHSDKFNGYSVRCRKN